MIAGGKLLAWIESRGDKVVAAFIGVMPPTWENPRDPGTRTFASLEDARRWVESEERALAVPIEWVKHSASPARSPRPNQAALIGGPDRALCRCSMPGTSSLLPLEVDQRPPSSRANPPR
jgi:hypothetical protein